MGFSHQDCIFVPRNRHLVISLLLLFASFFPQELIFAHGRAISDPVEPLKEERVVVMERALIGSRPPRCEGRCTNCGHCEAIQVPIVPQQGFPRSHFVHKTPTSGGPAIVYSRSDDLSNYKPMSWKCKCGNSIFNP